MKFKKTISVILTACILFAFVACSSNNESTQEETENNSQEQLVNDSSSTTDTTVTETSTTEYENEEIAESDEDQEIGSYTWNPYVWNDSLTNTFGETSKDAIFNCITAVMNGDDTFEYAEDKDLQIIFYLAEPICPFLNQIIANPIQGENGIATLEYLCSKEEAKVIIDDFAKEVESIINESCKETDSDEVKAMMIHYNFSKTLTYDYDALDAEVKLVSHPSSAYDAIMYRKEICQGFAQALVYLYLQVGLDVDLGRGATDTSMHMFVYINLNGEEIFIDPTWESSREGTGLSFFGINTNFYNDNELTVRDSLNFVSNEAYNGNLTSEKYKPLWQMKEILSITREDENLAIDYIDSEGNEMQFIVPN